MRMDGKLNVPSVLFPVEEPTASTEEEKGWILELVWKLW
jgi:hypothetical protein